MIYFFRLFRDYNRCRCALWRPLTVFLYIDIILFFLLFPVLVRFKLSPFETEYISPGGLRNVASSSITYEQTLSNKVYCFQDLNAVFPKSPPFSYYLDITTTFVVTCGGLEKYPRISILCCLFLHILVLWVSRV